MYLQQKYVLYKIYDFYMLCANTIDMFIGTQQLEVRRKKLVTQKKLL